MRGALAMVLSARRDGRAFVLPQASRRGGGAGARRHRASGAHAARRVRAPRGRRAAAAARRGARARRPARRRPISPTCAARRHAKRALEIAAAGGHALLMCGPPGTGKTMLAQRLPALLPPLDEDEALEVAAIASLAGRFDAARWRERPFRAPHHTASARGARRRRQPAAARRDLARAPRRAVPRRAARVASGTCSRCCASRSSRASCRSRARRARARSRRSSSSSPR